MKKSSFKLYFATFVLTLILASLSFAGEVQCPFASPPPGEGERATVPVIVDTNLSVNNNYQFLKGFWEFLAQNTDLF